jgi:hypothetical protein
MVNKFKTLFQKALFILSIFLFSLSSVYSQCNCKGDNTVKYCVAEKIAYKDYQSVFLMGAKSESYSSTFITISVVFGAGLFSESSPKSITGNLNITFDDGTFVTLSPTRKSQMVKGENAVRCEASFEVNASNKSKLKNKRIKFINLKYANDSGMSTQFILDDNKDVIIKHLNCLQ